LHSITVDYLIVGGGIFGAFAAKHLAPHASILLIEKESSLLSRASKCNQTRLHAGFHYLRAPQTALEANLYFNRFLKDHEFAINKTFSHFYGIARHGSLTDAQGFERFCEWLDLDANKQKSFDMVDSNRISEVYLVEEYSFDPYLLSQYYYNELVNSNVQLFLNSEIISAKQNGDSWLLQVRDAQNELVMVETKCVINATYSNLNSVSKLFNLPELQIKHEYSELLLAYVPSLRDKALTVMDGPFLSITPYGLTGLHVLSSVIYTHHASTESSGLKMACQNENRICDVDRFDVCQSCLNRPQPAKKFMLNQLKAFVPNIGDIFVHGQIETVKSTRNMGDYRDERKTSISKLASGPDFYTVMSGKVSSIYEMEALFNVS